MKQKWRWTRSICVQCNKHPSQICRGPGVNSRRAKGWELNKMADVALGTEEYHGRGAPHLNQKSGIWGAVIFFCVLAAGIGYGVHGVLDDIQSVHEPLELGVFAMLFQ